MNVYTELGTCSFPIRVEVYSQVDRKATRIPDLLAWLIKPSVDVGTVISCPWPDVQGPVSLNCAIPSDHVLIGRRVISFSTG